MYTAAAIAKKYGLEQYLDKPDELNIAIFNLMLLQEAIQTEQARKKRRDHPERETISIRRVAVGKLVAGAVTEPKYRYAVETALKASTEVLAVFQRARFIRMLTNVGIPEAVITELCATITIDDDTHCMDPE